MNKILKEEKKEIKDLIEKLFPICRSITGDGVRKSLKILQRYEFFKIMSLPSGMKCYDWKIPLEWNIKDAFIENENGEKVVDFKENNLHLVSYSVPIKQKMSYDKLVTHLHTLENFPEAIPYRTSYYDKNWGFCLSHSKFKKLNKNSSYNVIIDSSLKEGKLNYGEYVFRGKTKFEFLFSTYCCHPSMANDNLSGMIAWIVLLKILKKMKLRHGYRFIIIPETIGSIAYLKKNQKIMQKVTGGFILTCMGGNGNLSYKKTFLENSFIDKIVLDVLKMKNADYTSYPFSIRGSDERQFSSPYFRIPIGTLCRDKYHEYQEYHTSEDNLNFLKINNLINTIEIYLNIICELESKNNFLINSKKIKKSSTKFISNHPYCEPMLSKRELYPKIGGGINQKSNKKSINPQQKISEAISWILFYSDGETSLSDIQQLTKIPIQILEKSIKILIEKKLIVEVKD